MVTLPRVPMSTGFASHIKYCMKLPSVQCVRNIGNTPQGALREAASFDQPSIDGSERACHPVTRCLPRLRSLLQWAGHPQVADEGVKVGSVKVPCEGTRC